MKTTLTFIITAVLSLSTLTAISQSESDYNDLAELSAVTEKVDEKFYGDHGFKFETFKTGINTKYSDYGVGFFREKFISFSARKIGALAKRDPETGEPFTKLYCSDITYEYNLKRPQLFSSILNHHGLKFLYNFLLTI